MRRLPLILLLVACGTETDQGPRTKIFGGDRPAELKTPATLTEGKLYPLLVVLHGFGANGFVQTAYFGVAGLPTDDKVLLIAPDGTTNSAGRQFWNADPACCDQEGQNPDDVGYIGGLIDDISAEWPVDKNKVFLLGHSNGGYMAYRMACERADAIAAIASLAGNAATNPSACNPAREVNVLHLHGTLDDIVPYSGAEPSVNQWASHNGCGTLGQPGFTLDLDSSVEGPETQLAVVADCPANGQIELWRMMGSNHVPVMNSSFPTTIFEWFDQHAR